MRETSHPWLRAAILALLVGACEGRPPLVQVKPRLQVPTSVDVGPVWLGEVGSVQVRLLNAGRGGEVVHLFTPPPFYLEDAGPLALEAGATLEVRVSFIPKSEGPAEGTLQVVGAHGEALVRLTGLGRQPPSCTSPSTCEQARFDTQSRNCVVEALADGTPCEEACTQGGTCQGGRCLGSPRACPSDDNACTQDICVEGDGCRHLDASSQCTSPSSCQVASCHPTAGCQLSPVVDGTPCGPAACGLLQVCLSGACVKRQAPVGTPMTAPCNRAVNISVGRYHACALMQDGNVACWGNSVGDVSTRKNPVPRLEWIHGDAVKVRSGEDTACFQRAAGNVLCWGYERNGSLGVGPPTRRVMTPVELPRLFGAVDFDLSRYVGCAVLAAGRVSCSGVSHSHGQATDDLVWSHELVPDFGSTTQIHLDNGGHVCANREDGAVFCWGEIVLPPYSGMQVPITQYPTPTRLSDLQDVVQVANGRRFSCARTRDGRVSCWGLNSSGQMGQGTFDGYDTRWPYHAPQEVLGLSGVVQVYAGEATACALRADGTLWCWGQALHDADFSWDIPNGTLGPMHLTPTQVKGIDDILAFDVGGYTACAVRRDGTVWCWGDNGYGQCGAETPPNKYGNFSDVPQPIQVQFPW